MRDELQAGVFPALLLLLAQLHCATPAPGPAAPTSSVSPAGLVEEAAALIERESLDAARVDWSAVRASVPRDVATVDEAHAAIRGMLAKLRAPSERLLSARQAAALLTVARVQTPSGRDILDQALEPSLAVASEGSPGGDAARQRALEWLAERR